MSNTVFYTNSRNVLTKYEEENTNIPTYLKGTFWGRVSGFDFKAVRAMLKKEPRLIVVKWGNSNAISWLFNPERSYLFLQRLQIHQYRQNRMPKMLRLLLEKGSIVDNIVVENFLLTHFSSKDVAQRCFRILLHDKDFVQIISQIKVKNSQNIGEGGELIMSHQRFRLRMLTNRIWGHKVPPEMMWEIGEFL